MKKIISYLVTCKNEGDQIKPLLELLYKYKDLSECIILDDFSTDLQTNKILEDASSTDDNFYKLYKHALNNNYSDHKNYGKSLCSGEYIFQLDADEIPSESLLQSIKDLIDINRDVDVFWIPRINNFIGVTDIEANQWGWKLTKIPALVQEKAISINSYEYKFLKLNGYIIKEFPYNNLLINIIYNPPIVNAPDQQGRLFKNIPSLKWERRLHEKIEGAKVFSHIPLDSEYVIFHNKTIAKQIETNLRYNKQFSAEDNNGFRY